MSSSATASSNSNDNEGTEKLLAREIPSAVNSEALIEEHKRVNKGIVRTRFPPEPNGYLHVGHAKSMNMNFRLSFEKLGVAPENRETIFRYDDTNPEAESKEYIDSLANDVAWLGWKPVRTTYTSDYFDKLYDLAIELIKRGKAYVCHQSKDQIEESREICRAKIADPNHPGNPNSPWRDRPMEENLKLFDDMRKGKFNASDCTLRLKMDMTSPNPNMWDQVAYRIKYVPHPHAGDKWCIYPTYDYTHCIIDSLEHIDYSICTLEFETRRESYYWVLEALDMYRPKVYEMSRLNISYTVLSKRKLLKLVMNGYMRGWDDPRMPTISGLRRRGYTKEILNAFCMEIGVTRNFNTVQYERLTNHARIQLHETAPRVMAVINAIKVTIRGKATESTHDVPDFPFEKAGSHSHSITYGNTFYIDGNDFRIEDSADYFGLAPGKIVGLKYCNAKIKCVDVIRNANGDPIEIICDDVTTPDGDNKAKVTIQWVPERGATPVEVRMYSHLFLTEEVNDAEWEALLNPKSEVVLRGFIDGSITSHYKAVSGMHFQFERIGFFICDKESSAENLVFNLTVALKDSKPTLASSDPAASAAGAGSSKSRKEEQDRALAEKLAKQSVRAEDFFKTQTNLYSQFDAEGVPTHDNEGKELSKSAFKKLKKDWEKQDRLYKDWLEKTQKK